MTSNQEVAKLNAEWDDLHGVSLECHRVTLPLGMKMAAGEALSELERDTFNQVLDFQMALSKKKGEIVDELGKLLDEP